MSLDAIRAEVEGGLQAHSQRRDAARMARDFYDLNGLCYLRKRDDESTVAFQRRPKRAVPFVRHAIEQLTEDLHNPGPTREFQGSASANTFIKRVYESEDWPSLAATLDRWAHLGNAAAVKVHCTGDPERPVHLDLFAADEFAVWCADGDPCRPTAVCTVEQYQDEAGCPYQVYRLWTSDTLSTFPTKPLEYGQTTGGRVSSLTRTEANPYGRLPFGFVHLDPPVSDFFPRSPGLGTFLAQINAHLDESESDEAQVIQRYRCPRGFASGAPPEWRNTVMVGDFQVLQALRPGEKPELWYAQPDLSGLEVGRMSEAEYADAVLQQLGIPPMPGRGRADASSGIALIVERLPLTRRAQQRRPHWQKYESEIAAAILGCAGAFYNRPDLTAASKTPKLVLGWVERTLPVPDPSIEAYRQARLDSGRVSKIGLIQEERGISREQAIEVYRQVLRDRAEEREIEREVLGDTPAEHQQTGMNVFHEPDEPEDEETDG